MSLSVIAVWVAVPGGAIASPTAATAHKGTSTALERMGGHVCSWVRWRRFPVLAREDNCRVYLGI